jgi:hypothetical protein
MFSSSRASPVLPRHQAPTNDSSESAINSPRNVGVHAGPLGKLAELIHAFSDMVGFEAWGRSSAPIPRCHPYPGYRKLARRPAYVLDICARRDKPLGSTAGNWTLRGRAAQLTRYPISLNLYRGLRKAGAMPDAEWRGG